MDIINIKAITDWHLKQIPKIVYFYWGCPKLPFLRFMSIYSFRKFNPNWKVVLLKPLYLSSVQIWPDKQFETSNLDFLDYSYLLDQIDVDIEFFDFEGIGVPNNMNEVHKSDILRYHLLHSRGGVWSDMDILYFSQIENSSSNLDANVDKKAFVFSNNECEGILGHAIGFLMGSKNNDFYKAVYDRCLTSQTSAYQGYGPELLNNFFHLDENLMEKYSIHNLGKNDVYAFDHHTSKDILYVNFDYTKFKNLLERECIGIHWYGGSLCVRQILLGLNHKNYLNYQNSGLLLFLLKKYFENFIAS